MKIAFSIYVIGFMIGALAAMLKCRNSWDKDYELYAITMMFFWPVVIPFMCIIWLNDRMVKWKNR